MLRHHAPFEHAHVSLHEKMASTAHCLACGETERQKIFVQSGTEKHVKF